MNEEIARAKRELETEEGLLELRERRLAAERNRTKFIEMDCADHRKIVEQLRQRLKELQDAAK